jgi:hypothetical protein
MELTCFNLIELHQIALHHKDQLRQPELINIMLPSPIAEMLERNRYACKPSPRCLRKTRPNTN